MSYKITILPSFAEVKLLGELMMKKEYATVENDIKRWLKATKCPFTTSADILEKSIYKNNSTRSICKIVAKNLSPYNTDTCFADKRTKLKVAEMVIQFSLNNRKFLVEAFKLDQPNLMLVQKIAKQHLCENNLNKFFLYHELFNLHDPEVTEKVFVPAVAKGDFPSVLRYINNSEVCQVHLMEVVDRLSVDTYYLNSFRHIPANTGFIKSLEKFLTNTLKRKYPESYSKAKLPGVNRVKILKTIEYLLINYYWKKNDFIIGSSLEDLVFRYIGHNYEMLRAIANSVHGKFKDKTRASLLIQSFESGHRKHAVWRNDQEKPVGSHQVKLTIPIENVVMIDNPQKLQDCLDNHFLKHKDPNNLLPVGFDAEWISSPSDMTEEDLGLIQLAVGDHVFLIDFLQFQLDGQLDSLNKFVRHIFHSDHILPLSFGTCGDRKVLGSYFPNSLWSKDTNFIDFMQVRGSVEFDEVCGEDSAVCPHTGKKLQGLGRFCNQVLGKSVNKNYQISDWLRRPLRQNQIIYAAVDAHCLLLAYRKIKENFEKSPHSEKHESLYEFYKECARKVLMEKEQAQREAKKEKRRSKDDLKRKNDTKNNNNNGHSKKTKFFK